MTAAATHYPVLQRQTDSDDFIIQVMLAALDITLHARTHARIISLCVAEGVGSKTTRTTIQKRQMTFSYFFKTGTTMTENHLPITDLITIESSH